ncbi:glycine betaine ABC transporter substrate-binding protein [Salicibibacter cibarius]|uniref:Glycine betaine ABC transporter substrate-binding protein n=2 Tax=Salicibibacter cibarius TaxID=2743000 RepID=A0A7T6Z7F3_9BACI|nr:glycine betaine ABC transporter substrate-binding protein [Salicibibacter cibarius]
MTACGNGNGEEGNDEIGDSIQIGYTNYAENTVVSAMWAQLLEEQGYDVTRSSLEKAALYEGVETGDVDIGFSAWLPFTDDHFVSDDAHDVQEEGAFYEGTELGIAVPSYMEDVETIADLNDYVDELDGTIIGIDPGAAISSTTEEEIIPYYDLEFTLQTSSEQGMLSAFDSAYAEEEPIAVTLWSPHWTFGNYDIKYLGDPDNVYGDDDDIYYIARHGLAEEESQIIEWLNNLHFTDDQLSELLTLQNELEDDDEAAQQWMENNQEVVDEWLE